MLRKAFALLGLGMVIFLLHSVSFAGVPPTINYQGVLTASDGGRIEATLPMVFRIYADSTTLVELWSETHDSVKIEEGIFNVLLGSVVPIPDIVFDGNTRYLGLTVGDDDEMQPRKPLVSVVYAYRTAIADVADLASGVASNTIGTEQIIDGSIDFADIGNNDAGAGQVMKWSGTAWVAGDDAGGGTSQVTGGAGITVTGDADSFMVSVSDNGITSSMLTNGSVNTDKIVDAAVAATKLSDGAVTSTKLSTGAVITDKLATNAVSGNKIQANAVTTDKIADASILFGDINQNGAGADQVIKWSGTNWVAGDDASGGTYQVTAGAGIAVTGDADSFMVSVADNGITTAKLADNSVTTGKIGSAAVDATKLSDGAVTTTKILDAAVTNTKLSTGVVTTDKLATDAVSSDKILSNAVTSDKIADASILFGDINQNGAGAGQVIKWSGTNWVAGDDASGGTYQVTSPTTR
jgi:hypothetical protein